MIQFACTHCQAHLTVSDDKAGKSGKCPKCGGPIHVPPVQAKQDEGEISFAEEPRQAGAAEDAPQRPRAIGSPPARERRAIEGGELSLAGGEGSDEGAKRNQEEPAATEGGITITPAKDALVVSFQDSKVLDAQVIDAIGLKLYALVDERACRKIILDFSNVQFLSSQMMGVLVTLHKKAADTGGRLLLCSLRSELSKVIQLVRLERILQIAPDKNAALKALSKP